MDARNLKKEFEEKINNNHVFLFMKGTPASPRCGFSFRVVNLLKNLEVDFKTYDILEDQELREAIKEFSEWPTYPQLYVKGEFVGGCEVLEELAEIGKLKELLGS